MIRLESVLKAFGFLASSRRLTKTSSRYLQDVLKTSSKRLEGVLKMSWRSFCKTSSRRLEDVLKTSWKRLEDVLKMFWRRLEDVLKTFLQDVLKTSWKRLEDVWPRRMQARIQHLKEVSQVDEIVQCFLLFQILTVWTFLCIIIRAKVWAS